MINEAIKCATGNVVHVRGRFIQGRLVEGLGGDLVTELHNLVIIVETR